MCQISYECVRYDLTLLLPIDYFIKIMPFLDSIIYKWYVAIFRDLDVGSIGQSGMLYPFSVSEDLSCEHCHYTQIPFMVPVFNETLSWLHIFQNGYEKFKFIILIMDIRNADAKW